MTNIKIVTQRSNWPKEYHCPGYFPIAIDLDKHLYYNMGKTKPLKRINKKIITGPINIESNVGSARITKALLNIEETSDIKHETLLNTLKELTNKQVNNHLDLLLNKPYSEGVYLSTYLWQGIRCLFTNTKVRYNLSGVGFDQDLIPEEYWNSHGLYLSVHGGIKAVVKIDSKGQITTLAETKKCDIRKGSVVPLFYV